MVSQDFIKNLLKLIHSIEKNIMINFSQMIEKIERGSSVWVRKVLFTRPAFSRMNEIKMITFVCDKSEKWKILHTGWMIVSI
jgi:hypothetical protein